MSGSPDTATELKALREQMAAMSDKLTKMNLLLLETRVYAMRIAHGRMHGSVPCRTDDDFDVLGDQRKHRSRIVDAVDTWEDAAWEETNEVEDS